MQVDLHFRHEPHGGATLRRLDDITQRIELSRDELAWLALTLSTERAVLRAICPACGSSIERGPATKKLLTPAEVEP